MSMAYFGSTLQSSIKLVQKHKGSGVNIGIVGGTQALKKIIQLNEKFRCPCVSLKSCKHDIIKPYNSTYGSECPKSVNFYYGISYILLPAIAFYFVGLLATPKLRNIILGCFTSAPGINQRKISRLTAILALNVKALLAPCTWLVIMLLDGKYLACAVTPLPYDVGEKKTYASCSAVANTETIYTSDAFNTNMIISQIIGWAVFAVLTCIGLIAFALTASSSPHTYYHANYLKINKEHEEDKLNDEMKIKAQADAEANVRCFLAERRSKKDWDEISQAYDYREDKRTPSIHSCLHQWVLNNPQNTSSMTHQQNSFQSLDSENTCETISQPLVPK